MRIIAVTNLRQGDIVQPGTKPQRVEYARVRSDGTVRLRLSGEKPQLVHAGFVYMLIRKASE